MELPAHLDVHAVWREVRNRLREALGESMYMVWIEPLEAEGLSETTLVLKAPDATEAWLSKRYGRVLADSVRAVLGPSAEVAFGEAAERPGRGRLQGGGGGGGGSHRGQSDTAATEPDVQPGELNPRYTFEQFIIGDNNQLAHAAALAVAELPGQAYNPLFLYAPPGSGKTHLLHAIGNYVLAYGGGAKVRYTTVEAFTNHFITALGKRSLDRFKRAYRDADVLLIDDVQFLASKAKTEEEFFHTFNALYENGRQLVLTADRLPSQLEGIAERLRERFEAGLVADIEPPTFSTRVAILRKRAALDGIPLAEDGVLELIARCVSDNVRALEGALIRVVAYHSLTGQPIDLALTGRVLDGMNYRRPEVGTGPLGARTVSIQAIQRAVAARYGLSVEELVSASRTARVAWARQLAIHLARELTGAPVVAIGTAFGGRNHATVLHACKRVAQRMSDDQQAAGEVDELTRTLCDEPGDRSY